MPGALIGGVASHLTIVGVLGFVEQWIEAGDIQQASGLTGTLAEQIETAMSQPTSTRWVATIVGLVGMAWAGRALSKVMVTALADSAEVLTPAQRAKVGAAMAARHREH